MSIQKPPTQELALIQGMLAAIPDAEEDGYTEILTQLAKATSAAELSEPWMTENLQDYKDVTISILKAKKAESDFQEGAGYFLILDIVAEDTGEKVTVTTGSVAVVGQVAQAAALGLFPLTCVPKVADRPNRKGYYPQRLDTTVPQKRKREEIVLEAQPTSDEPLPF